MLGASLIPMRCAMRVWLLLGFLVVASGWAQEPAPDGCALRKRASFDVVSVHAVPDVGRPSALNDVGDSMRVNSMTLKAMLAVAFGLRKSQITGFPDCGN